MAKAPKEKEPQNKEEASKNLLNSLLAGYADDHYNNIRDTPVKISLGSLTLDILLKQIETGSIFRAAGPTNSGKTSQAFLLMSNYLKTVPNSKGFYVKAEARLSENLQHRTGLTFVFSADEWKIGTVFVLEANQFEVVADMIENLLKAMYQNGEKMCCIVDSLDGLILSNDLKDKKIGESSKVAGVPSMLKMFNRRIALPINKYGALFIMISQASSSISINPYSKEPPRPVNGSGGASAAHSADVILEYLPRYNGDLILKDPKAKPSASNPILGHECSIKIIKSTNEADFLTCKIPIRRGRVNNSVWVERELVDVCCSFELIKKRGAWFDVSESLIEEAKSAGITLKEQFQGIDSIYEYMEENKDTFNWLYERVRKAILQ